MLTVATINVNGLRAAVRRGMPAWQQECAPDVMLLQELRAPDDVVRELLGPDWHVVHVEAAAKGRAGVAIASRLPFEAVRPLLPVAEGAEEPEGDVGRWVEADVRLPDGRVLTLVSTYLYSGTAGTPSMDAKYAHLDRVTARLVELAAAELAVVGGDINVGHRELDIKNWKGNRTSAGFLPAERAYLDRWYDELGLVDVGRRVAGEVAGPYTWWSWRGKAFDNDSGWRIDVQAATPALAAVVDEARVDRAATYAERFSDHAPFVVRYDVG
ncbi:exodeoxyribonuclease III [Serinibacter arcticus]|uniref:exodeoxyribonuclease III n=1 Tax=Serinibacter arcticus TaxID=1655435 RepID=UPI001F1DB1D0|nr:exodeoxyribonuclease III [Serinibacter arcticus]